MATVVVLPDAETQMEDALAHTLERFGEAKYLEYLELIQSAVRTVEQEPQAGRKREDIHPEAWTYHIARTGQRARHLLLYRVRGDRVEVGRFLYDGMDLPQHWPEPWEERADDREGEG